jgi:hypothetical protein
MNEQMILLKAQAFDMLAAEIQKTAVAHQLLFKIANELGVQDINAIIPEVQKLKANG